MTACQQDDGRTQTAAQTAESTTTHTYQPASPTPTFTPSLTPSPSPTPSRTPTPTITPTPTPTAPPISISEDLHPDQISTPVYTGSAPCGLVDTLDFPLDPPDGATASGGSDFGIFRSRYDKFHAGEDWWGVRGRTTFGLPVYSIGHGLVTYAQPEGWGQDKGVIIVLHTFNDGSEVLSFYGHLDPPSFLVQAGDCIERGQQIANIGRPRSSPHLHFEIRTQGPYETLTGYWPEDPTSVGWLPPSAVIWRERLRNAPGILWTMPDSLPYTNEDIDLVGLYHQETLITLQDDQLTGISIENGRQIWQLEKDEPDEEEETGITAVYQAMIDSRFPIVYIANRSGQLAALSLLGNQTGPPAPLWEIELDLFGQPDLLPLPDGGLLFAARDQLYAINPEGAILWQQEDIPEPDHNLQLPDGLLLAAAGNQPYIGMADSNGLTIWEVDPDMWPVNAVPIAAGEQIWLYNRDGLYRLDLETQTADLLIPLPRGLTSQGDIIGLPDGGLLLAHADTADRRLLAYNPDGTLHWERSYQGVIDGAVQLIEQNGRIYLTNIDNGTLNNTFSIYAIDLDNPDLTQLFFGGTRSGNLGQSWLVPTGDRIIINIQGGMLLALAPLP